MRARILLLPKINGCPKHTTPIGVEQFWINYLRIRQLAFNFLNAPLDERLALLCGIVFGVLRQIAV